MILVSHHLCLHMLLLLLLFFSFFLPCPSIDLSFRDRFVYGYQLPKDMMAFSQPTNLGRKLAIKFFERDDFLIYSESTRPWVKISSYRVFQHFFRSSNSWIIKKKNQEVAIISMDSEKMKWFNIRSTFSMRILWTGCVGN